MSSARRGRAPPGSSDGGATAARRGRSPSPPLATARRGHALPGYSGGGAAAARRGRTPSALPSAGWRRRGVDVLLPAPRRRGDGGKARPLYPRFSGGVVTALLSAPHPLLRGALLVQRAAPGGQCSPLVSSAAARRLLPRVVLHLMPLFLQCAAPGGQCSPLALLGRSMKIALGSIFEGRFPGAGRFSRGLFLNYYILHTIVPAVLSYNTICIVRCPAASIRRQNYFQKKNQSSKPKERQ